MYQLLQSFIGYTGSYNYEQYYVYGSIAIAIILVITFIDLVYRVFRAILNISK